MIYFVGAGPGAVDLITVRGQNLLRAADVVIYAGSLVNPALLDICKEDTRIFDSQDLSLEEIVAIMERASKMGLELVRLHTGDPSIYGAVREQMDALEDLGIEYTCVPGVSACFGAAASLHLEYTLPEITQTLIITRMAGRTPVPDNESLDRLASHGASMALFLSAAHAERVQESLLAGGAYQKDTPVAVVFKATWPEEKKLFCTVGTMAKTMEEAQIAHTALIIVGEAVARSGGTDLGAHETVRTRSKLYDPTFDNDGNEE